MMIKKNYGNGLPVFDRRTALMYSGDDEDLLREVAKNFLEQRSVVTNNLTSAFAEEDWKNYTTFAHGLKSSSLTLGGKKLSDLAKSMEQAGKDYAAANEDDKTTFVDYIKANHGELLKLYEEFCALLGKEIQ